MKLLRFCLLFLPVTILFLSCQKELTVEEVEAIGTLKFEASGDCLPVLINGSYQKDTLLTANNYMDIAVDISQTGNYTITTDTVNGYYFNATGAVSQAGLNTIRLQAHGRPIVTGVDVFTVIFSGTSCEVNIIVTAPSVVVVPAAIYSFGGSPGACSGAVMSGTFEQGIPMGISNTATLTVNITTPGAYNITTGTVNGVTFSGSGVFATIGVATVILTAAGTPVATASSAYSVNSGTGSCSFSVVYAAPSGPATYSIICSTPVIAGNYIQGVATTAANTVTLPITVTTPGIYNVATAAVNGVIFTGTGSFTAAGAATILLTASGTPIAATTAAHTVNSGSGSCSFNVIYAALPTTPAVYSMDCSTLAFTGSYHVGVPMNSSNSITLNVNVTTPGTYFINGNAPGFTFSATGTFTTAPTTVTLTIPATGTPSAAVTYPIPLIPTSGFPCTPLITILP